MQYKSLSTYVPINTNSGTYGYAQIQKTCEITYMYPLLSLTPPKPRAILLMCTQIKHRKGLLPVTDNPYLFSLPPSTAFSQIFWKQGKSKPRTRLSYTPITILNNLPSPCIALDTSLAFKAQRTTTSVTVRMKSMNQILKGFTVTHRRFAYRKPKVNSCLIFPPFLPPPIVWDTYSQNYSDIK